MTEKTYHIWGWILFIICAFLFIAGSLVNGDPWGLAGSIIFLAACICFIIPIFQNKRKGCGSTDPPTGRNIFTR